MTECNECKGHGEIELFTSVVKCDECDGTGETGIDPWGAFLESARSVDILDSFPVESLPEPLEEEQDGEPLEREVGLPFSKVEFIELYVEEVKNKSET